MYLLLQLALGMVLGALLIIAIFRTILGIIQIIIGLLMLAVSYTFDGIVWCIRPIRRKITRRRIAARCAFRPRVTSEEKSSYDQLLPCTSMKYC